MRMMRAQRGERYDPDGDRERMLVRLAAVITRHARKLELPLQDPDIIRVDGNAVCPECGQTYYSHPHDLVNVSGIDGEWYLYIGCDGRRLKT